MAGRLSTLAAAFVVARRDFNAILFSRSFFFFLLGPLFPVIVAVLAGGVGQQVQRSADRPELGIAMQAADLQAMRTAHESLAPGLDGVLPELRVIALLDADAAFDAASHLRDQRGNVAAILTGTPAKPVLTGTAERIGEWRGLVSLLASRALEESPRAYPEVALVNTTASTASDRRTQLITAQAAQTLLFLLTMLLAGMVLSNLVEEKANKIIEILAAAIPMDAVFLGKLFAMLAVSFVGIGVWGLAVGGLLLAAGPQMLDLAAPAVGWPLFFALGVVYFATSYLLLGSVFLAIGSLAATVREVQTLSMPVTMLQLLVFFLASYAMTEPGSFVEQAAAIFPFSSPFVMLARAAQDETLWVHGVLIAWQLLCVLIFVRMGARLFRKRVMQSGPSHARAGKRGLLARWRRAKA